MADTRKLYLKGTHFSGIFRAGAYERVSGKNTTIPNKPLWDLPLKTFPC